MLQQQWNLKYAQLAVLCILERNSYQHHIINYCYIKNKDVDIIIQIYMKIRENDQFVHQLRRVTLNIAGHLSAYVKDIIKLYCLNLSSIYFNITMV